MEGDGPEGYEAFFRATFPQATDVARRIVGSLTEAEDVAAEAMAKALLRWSRIGRLEHREAWVLRVTINEAIDVATKRRRAIPATAAEVRAADDETVLRATLVAALKALPTRQREAIVLRHMAGLSEHEVAASLGVSHNTAKKHLQRGLAKLRTTIGNDADLAIEEARP